MRTWKTRATSNAIDQAHGDVLIGELSIGLLLQGLEKNKNVTSMTCVESDHDLIDFL
ncbi:MAG TPA: hypothetical protein VK141_03080 [Nitrosomonas sp.]|nr:hypothetical protein [Nitrosomonas sp.]